MAKTAARRCGAKGPRVAYDVPNGWGSSPSCELVEGHIGNHVFNSMCGFTILWTWESMRSGVPWNDSNADPLAWLDAEGLLPTTLPHRATPISDCSWGQL